MKNSEEQYTDYMENPIDVKDISVIKLKSGMPENKIADLASDLVYGEVPNGEGTGLEGIPIISINSYPKDGSREHNLLHTYYKMYKYKKDKIEFENAPLEVVKTWDKDRQTKWFTAQMNKGAKTVLPALAGVMTLPWTISTAVAAPITTALSIGGGLLGSKIGGDYGRKIDTRRHGYTNNEELYGTIGGLVGGSLGAGVGNYAGNRITFTSGNRYRDANSWKWGNEFNEYGRKLRNKGYGPMKFQEWVKTYKMSPLEKLAADHRVIGTTQYINDGYSNWFRSISPKSKMLGTAFGIVSRLNPPSKETLTNWSNRLQLNRWITEGDGLITQIYPKQKNHIDLNTPRTFYSTKNPYFTEKGIRPGESGLMWYSKNRGYFVDGINGDPIPPHVTLKVNPKELVLHGDPLHPHIPIEKSPVVVSEGILPYQNIKLAVEYDPLLKTFLKYDFKNPSSNLGVTPKGMFIFYERPQTPFKTAKYAGSPGTCNGKTVPAWQLPKGQRNQPKKIVDYVSLSDKGWDGMYFNSIKTGNLDKTQELRNLHFKIKAPNTKSIDSDGNLVKTYRGQQTSEQFRNLRVNPYSDNHGIENGYYSSTSDLVAETYRRNFGKDDVGDLVQLYTNFQNPITVDAEGRLWHKVFLNKKGEWLSGDDIYAGVSKLGYDGVIIKNVNDIGTFGPSTSLFGTPNAIATDYIGTPGTNKLVNAITYDNSGNIIPLSKRDNFLKHDIRYITLPAAGIAGIAGVSE